MRLKVETFFKVQVWDNRFLLMTDYLDWTKAIMTNQGLDRIGDGYWISGIHLGTGGKEFAETSTGVTSELIYKDQASRDESTVSKTDKDIVWSREIEYRFSYKEIATNMVSEMSLSWDDDAKTATALLFNTTLNTINADQDLVVTVRVDVSESLSDVHTGRIDLGAVFHAYTIKPCFYERYSDTLIGIPLAQKDGRVYSGSIPADPAKEPEGAIDTDIGLFNAYSFETRSKTFSNFFTLSSPNAVTRVATSHTIGLPSAFGVEFDPPIDKDFNRELTLDFKINWDRGE